MYQNVLSQIKTYVGPNHNYVTKWDRLKNLILIVELKINVKLSLDSAPNMVALKTV